MEKNFARRDKSTHVDHLREDVRELLLRRNEHDFNPLVDDQPAEIELPAKEMGCLRSDTEFATEIIGCGIIDEEHDGYFEVNFEIACKLYGKYNTFA